ncbi:MAG: HWE histidine kinase domain-containing protein [Pseudomonadota bacterium]
MNKPDQEADISHSDVDLTNCDREAIHIPGMIQSFGVLISVTPDWIINHASTNAWKLFGDDEIDIVGQPFTDVFDQNTVHAIRSRLQMLSGPDMVDRIFGLKINGSGSSYNVALHNSGRSIVLEFEKMDVAETQEFNGYVRPMIERISRAKTIEQLCDMAARQVKALTGLDRVMIYRFAPDDSGEVIAEALQSGMEPFLGLNYPASDIPKQARAMYTRNLLRVIADVEDEGIEIRPTLSPEGEPLDLSMSTTRAVSPIHLEYLSNMGVHASMSISILRRGKLWGLIACHHKTPKIVPYQVRTAAELFAQLFSFVLDQKQSDLEREEVVRAQILHDQIMAQLAEDSSIGKNFDTIVEAIKGVIPYDGVAGWINGEFRSLGRTPTKDEFLALVPFLNTTAVSQIYATKCISKKHAAASEYADRAAGMLVLPVSRTPRDYLVLFRQEIAKSVKWAGNPEKPVTLGKNGARLTPRKSFEAWQQIVRDECADWTEGQVRAAEALRITLMEVVMRMSDQTIRERLQFEGQQELLIAELNHRVRNILNLIKGLVSQSQDGQQDVATFTAVLGGRIHALARAHDQITRKNWTPASLHELITTETKAHLGDQAERLTINGPDALLKPEAFSSMALVIHELMTNSAKYGALSGPAGGVTVEVAQGDDDGLALCWTEEGGPPVEVPKRRGFGTTIIERSVPFELQGKAEIRYQRGGVEATFFVPKIHIEHFAERPVEIVETKAPVSEKSFDYRNILVVEDNMIIALDAEMMLSEMGASHVVIAPSVNSALEALEGNQIDFALLDVNLGNETSLPVAEALQAKNIPFAFSTGYGEQSAVASRFPNAAVIQKPYDSDSLKAGITG